MMRLAKSVSAYLMALLVGVILCACIGTMHTYGVLATYGPGGRPLVLACNRGVLYFATSDMQVHMLEPHWVHAERWPESGVTWLMSATIVASDWEIGFQKQTVPGNGYTWAEPKWYGFSLAKGSNALNIPNTWYIFASLPAWFAGPLLAMVPLRRSFLFLRSRRQRRRGLCPVCAYDLRQSPERCPECGFVRSAV